MIAHQIGVRFADLRRATNELNRSTGYDIDFSIGVICSFFHDMYAFSCTAEWELVDCE